MPRARFPKSRVQILAEAFEALQLANEGMASINLSTVTTQGDLRGKIKKARDETSAAAQSLLEAIQADVPDQVTPMSRSRPAQSA